jgi:hypothetical protein
MGAIRGEVFEKYRVIHLDRLLRSNYEGYVRGLKSLYPDASVSLSNSQVQILGSAEFRGINYNSIVSFDSTSQLEFRLRLIPEHNLFFDHSSLTSILQSTKNIIFLRNFGAKVSVVPDNVSIMSVTFNQHKDQYTCSSLFVYLFQLSEELFEAQNMVNLERSLGNYSKNQKTTDFDEWGLRRLNI